MIDSLEKINLDFDENYQAIFNAPKLTQKYLNKRSDKFDQLIINEFKTDDGLYALNTFICKHKILGGNLIQRDIQNIKKKIASVITSQSNKSFTKVRSKNKKIFSKAKISRIQKRLNSRVVQLKKK